MTTHVQYRVRFPTYVNGDHHRLLTSAIGRVLYAVSVLPSFDRVPSFSSRRIAGATRPAHSFVDTGNRMFSLFDRCPNRCPTLVLSPLLCTAAPEMLRRSLASAALRPLTAVAHGRHSCARRLSITAAGDVSIALPKFLVTTVKTEQVGDKVTYNSSSIESSELPVFLVDVKYEGKASVAGRCWAGRYPKGKGKKWTEDEYGLGEFSGTAVSQVEFTSSITLATALTLGQS